MMRKFLKKLFCTHQDLYFIRNIGGDEINQISLRRIYRSEWKCRECGKYKFLPNLHKAERDKDE